MLFVCVCPGQSHLQPFDARHPFHGVLILSYVEDVYFTVCSPASHGVSPYACVLCRWCGVHVRAFESECRCIDICQSDSLSVCQSCYRRPRIGSCAFT